VILSDLGKYSSIILSGRRNNDSLMNSINSKIIKHCVSEKKPLLGICYGAEILALTLGGTIKKMDILHKGIEEVDVIKPNPICSGKMKVFQSHSYMVSKLDECFEQIGRSIHCKFEIFQYSDHKIFGTQFHPEMSDDGKHLLEKFIVIQ
jgi:GMP synthase (glutamine-hydrolysing)